MQPQYLQSGLKLESSLPLKISVSLVTIGLAFIYWFTAYTTITWWDNAEYSLAAITLGVPHPPGSLLLVVLGWLVTRLPLGFSDILALNLFAGLMAALTVGFVIGAGSRLLRWHSSGPDERLRTPVRFPVILAAAAGGLSFAFSRTVWEYAVRFTPYVLTALFTSLLLYALLRWWERADRGDAYKWIFALAILFALDFSVHRTNLLMLPGVAVILLIRRPRIVISGKSWLAGLGGLALGLVFHLLLIPIAARDPYLNVGNPSTFDSFWHYVSLTQYGGGWLVNLWPRKAPFLSHQLKDFFDAFATSFFSVRGRLPVLGLLPGLLGIAGFIGLWRENKRAAFSLTLLFLLTSLGAVVYFNFPENFFRSLDRHYLPSFVIFAVWIVFGAGMLVVRGRRLAGRKKVLAVVGTAFLLLISAGAQVTNNFMRVNGAHNTFTRDIGVNIFKTLPPNAVLFTFGDNDTWPLFYLQGAEGMRPDVTIINLPLSNTTWFMEQVLRRDLHYPTSMTPEEMTRVAVKEWADTTIAIPVRSAIDPSSPFIGRTLPESLYIRVAPTMADRYLLRQDQLALDLIIANNWRRPVYFTGSLPWLAPQLRFEGLAMQLVPEQDASLDREVLRRNLLESYTYDGFADPTIPIETPTRYFGVTLFHGFLALARLESAQGDGAGCREVSRSAALWLPPERLQLDSLLVAEFSGACTGR